jgi:hypothetical protein
LGGLFLHELRLNTLEGETMTLKEAICEVMQRGLSHGIFESDIKIFVDVVTSGQLGTFEFNIVISHIKSLLLLVPNFEITFVKLARAIYFLPSHYIFESIEYCIDNYLVNEMN